MGIAHSYPAPIHAEIDASSSSCLRSGLHQAVQMAGWVVDRAVTNGYVYVMTSLQDISIQCKVKIEDTGRSIDPFVSPVLDIVFMDIEEENVSQSYVLRHTSHGFGHPIDKIRAHIAPCQIFTYAAGSSLGGYSVMGGIPFLDPNVLAFTEDPCADEDSNIKTTRAWWSCGDLSTADYVYPVVSFRKSWSAWCSATLHNNDFVSESYSLGGEGRLRMLPLQRPTNFWDAYANSNSAYPIILRWIGTDEPLCLDPLIAWNKEQPVKIRGQLWDAFVRTKYVPWEDPLTFDGLEWFSYSMGDRQGDPATTPYAYSTGDLFTLYLRDPGLTYFDCRGSNYAY